MQSNRETPPTLKRCLGLRETITISAGTVIGVGLFTMGANVVGILGPTVLLATLAALAMTIYPTLLYGEMGAMLPYAGGTYQYASLGLGRPFGVLAGWNFVISMVSVVSGEALAFAFYLRTLLQALGLPLPISDTALACLALALFLLLALRGTQLGGRLQNGFLFFFWGVTLVWIVSMTGSFCTDSFAAPGQTAGFLPCVALVWWCFAGFETCCAMGEEIEHPQVNLPRALFLSPFLVFAVNALFQWVLVSIVPPTALAALADASAPYAEGMRLAGVTGFPLVLLCVGIAFGGDFSTLNAGVAAPARYLYTMARDGILPPVFARVHPVFRTPYVAILALGALMLILVGTGSITAIASLSLFATLSYYVLGIAAAVGLRRRCPDRPRPYRAPGLRVGAPVSIALYLLLMTQLEVTGIVVGLRNLGAPGAAIATVMAQTASLALIGLYLWRRGNLRQYRRKRPQLRAAAARQMLAAGLPIALQDGLVNVSFLILTALINHMGLTEYASVGVVEKLIVFSMLPTTAIASAIAAITAQHLGAGCMARARRCLEAGIFLALVFGVACFVAAQLAAPVLVGLFSSDPQVIETGGWYLRAYSFDCVLVCFVFCLNTYFSGGGHPVFPLVHSLISTVLVRLPLSWYLSRLPQADLFHIGFAAPLASLVSLGLCAAYLWRSVRQERLSGLLRADMD